MVVLPRTARRRVGAMSDDEGFFSRWSRRKTQLREGEAPPDKSTHVVSRPTEPANTPPINTLQSAAERVQASAARQTDAPSYDATPPELPPLTLADVAQLTPTSDFSRFVGAGVDESVQHAALKKLFSDPHFNVMDGLDTYIGDYNTPNPIPAAMMRRLVESKALRVFDAPPPGADAAPASVESAGMTPAPVLPQSAANAGISDPSAQARADITSCEPDTDEDTALRLQPDDAADATGAGKHRPGPRT